MSLLNQKDQHFANEFLKFFHYFIQWGALITDNKHYYQQILEPLGFVRIHKSHLINLEKVTRYIKGKGGLVCMSNNTELPVSPAKKWVLLEGLMG